VDRRAFRQSSRDRRGQQGTTYRPGAQFSAFRNAMAKVTFPPIASENQPPPNPRLQRTRSAPLRSPLSRKPFGAILTM